MPQQNKPSAASVKKSTIASRSKKAVAPKVASAKRSAASEKSRKKEPQNSELAWLQETLRQSHIAVYQWDIASDQLTWSENSGDIIGIESMAPLAQGALYQLLIPQPARDKCHTRRLTASENGYELEYNLHMPDGRNLHVQEKGRQILSDTGVVTGMVGMVMPRVISQYDITNSLLIKSALEEAYHYPANFMQALELTLSEHQAYKRKEPEGALIILSIDNMPMIVNGYGHDKSEHIIDDLSKAITRILHSKDRMFRIQRDQFAIIAPELSDSDMPDRVKALSDVLKYFGMQSRYQPLHIVPSCGSVSFEACHHTDVSIRAVQIIDKAYVALRANSLFMSAFPEELIGDEADSIKQMELAHYLHSAIHSGRLQLAYQPIIRSTSGEIAHYECLLRLRSDDGTVHSAGALIPVAERMGLIDIIDQMVLEMVVEDLLRDPDVVLAFNISNLTTTDKDWLDTFVRILEATPEIASRLIVEITETAAQRNLRDTAYFVASLQAMGCRVALDDFGSGYTSFRQLKGLSCDMIKIDGSFIKDIEDNPDNRFFVKTLLDFTKGFGMETVAECIETGESAKLLLDMGVDLMQGFYFGRPDNERSWIQDENAHKQNPAAPKKAKKKKT